MTRPSTATTDTAAEPDPLGRVQQQLEQLAGDHGGQRATRATGHYRFATAAGPLYLTALVVSQTTTWVEFARPVEPPTGAADWLARHVRPRLVHAIAAGAPGGPEPTAGTRSGAVSLPSYEAAAALAEWLPQELAWQGVSAERPHEVTR